MDQYNYSTPPPSSTDLFPQQQLVYGGFWERFGAAFLDGIILGIIKVVIDFFIIQDSPVTGGLINLVINWIYYASMESSERGATLGKMALGLKVVNEAGQRISFGQATGRYFGKILSTLILLIGYLMMLWDDKKQTLHDKLAGTLVVKI